MQIMKPSVLSFLLSFLILGVFFASCEKSKDEPEPPLEKSKRTVLVYLVGKNSISSHLEDDYEEIKEGFSKLKSSEDFNLLVFISNSGNFYIPRLLKLEKNEEGLVIEKIINTYNSSKDFNSTNVDVMQDILIDAYSSYPSESYGLVMESHADGWMPYPSIKVRAFGDDRKKSINITDLAKVLETVTHNIGAKLDYILFDACFMQSIEVAYELRHSVKHIIGSATEIPGPGGPYDILVPSLFDLNTNYSKQILDSYFEYYNEMYTGSPSTLSWTMGVALSSIDLQYIEKLTEQTKQLLTSTFDIKETIDLSKSRVPFYDNRGSASSPYSYTHFYFDIYYFMEYFLVDENKGLFEEWKKIFNQLVYSRNTPLVYTAHPGRMFSVEGTHGLSFYIPRTGYEPMTEHYKTHQWYRSGGWSDLGW